MKIHSIAPQVSQTFNNKNNVSFSGKPGFFREFLTLERQGNMSRKLFIANAFLFLLGGRVLKARDDNEKREIFTRDIPSIVLAVQGVPVIGEMVTKLIQSRSGFAIGNEYSEKDGFTLLREHRLEGIKGDGQLKDWYIFDENLAKLDGGFENFFTRLKDKGGNLKKICSSLSDEIKGKLTSFNESNVSFIKELNKSENKGLKVLIEEAFKGSKNKAFEKANFLKTIPRIIGFAMTLTLLGALIPKLNIHITRKLNKNKKAKEEEPIL